MKNSWLFVTALEQCIVTVQCIKGTGIKLLPTVIGEWQDVWHNDKGSSMQV